MLQWVRGNPRTALVCAEGGMTRPILWRTRCRGFGIRNPWKPTESIDQSVSPL